MSPNGHHRLDMLMPPGYFFCPASERFQGRHTHSLGLCLLHELRRKGKAPFACSISIRTRWEVLEAHKEYRTHCCKLLVDEISRMRVKAKLIPSLQGYPRGKTTALSDLSDFEHISYIHINRCISREGRLIGSCFLSVG